MQTRWLIYRQGAIGDTILLSSVLRAIRGADPDAWIEVMGELDRISLLLGSNLANSIFSSQDLPLESIYQKSEEIHPGLQNYFDRFTHILWFAGQADPRLEEKLRTHSEQYVRVHPALPHPELATHAVNHYLKALEGWIGYDEFIPPMIQLTTAEQQEAKQRFLSWGWNPDEDIVLGMHPGAGSEKKRAPIKRFLHITRRPRPGERIGVLLTEGPNDAEAVAEMREQLGETAMVQVLRNEPLRQVAAALSHCKRFIANDSGLAHMAAALDVTTDVFFVSSNPKQWAPIGDRVRIFDLRGQ